MDIHRYNADSWNQQSLSGESEWCEPVSDAVIERARAGEWSVILTPNKPVPADWFGDLSGARLLCLAGSGGQQAPVLAAAGAEVVSLDISSAQLAKDRGVAERHGLNLQTLEGDMSAIEAHVDGPFDLIFHPVSNLFAQDLAPVWQGCAAVLRPQGRLLSGFMNPDFFLFDHEALDRGEALELRYRVPFASIRDFSPAQLEAARARGEAMEFGHSLADQIGGQIAAGFVIAGFYQDDWSDEATPLNAHMPTSFATCAVRLGV